MKRRRHSPEQIVKHLREAEVMLGEGKTVAQVCKKLGVTEVTFYHWKREYQGATRDQIRRLQELEKENAQLKRVVECRRRRSGARNASFPR